MKKKIHEGCAQLENKTITKQQLLKIICHTFNFQVYINLIIIFKNQLLLVFFL